MSDASRPVAPPTARPARTRKDRAATGKSPELRQSTSRALDSISEGFIILDRDWRFVYVNPAAERFTLRSRAELTGQSLWEVFPEAASRMFGTEYRRAVAENAPVHFEEFYPEPLNRWYEVKAYPSPEGLSIFFSDVTERRETEKALRQSEERYRSLFNSMTEGFALHEIVCDDDGVACDYRFLEVNPAFESQTGLTRRDVVGRLMSEVLPTDDPHWVKTYGAVALTGESVRFDHFSPALGRHYEVFAYRPAPRHFAVLFHDVTARKRLEEALQVNLTKYSVLFGSFPLGISVSDPEGNIREANATAARLLGVPLEEHTSRRIDGGEWRIVRLDSSPMPPEEFASVRALKEQRLVEDVEMGVIRPDQDVTWLSVSAAPLRLEGYGVVVTYGDVSRRINAEAAVRRQEARHRVIIQTAMDGFWLVDAQGRLLEVNDAYCRMSGYTEQELLGVHVADLEAAESAAQTAAHMREIVASGEDRFESRHRRKDGREYDVDVCVQYRPADGGQFISFLRDITGRTTAERALRESEARHRTIIRTAMDGFWLVDLEGRLLEVNEAYCRMSGYSAAELLAMRIPDLEALETPEETAARIQVLMERGEERFESRHRRKDGSAFEVEVSVKYWLGDAGRFIVFLRDITERKTAEAEIEAANAALRHANESLEARVAERTAALEHRTDQLQSLAREFTRAEARERERVAQVIHDHLQQLLSLARINLDLARRQVRTRSTQQRLDELDGLIAEALGITRTLTAELSPAILHRSGLAAALRWLGRWYEERFALEVLVDAEGDVELDHEGRVTLFRAVRELLFNVVKHAKVARARVHLSQTVDRRARIVVRDEGAGFAPEVLRATDAAAEGFGLLSVRERLDMLGGQIEVTSSPGLGTSVTITGPPPGPVSSGTPATPPVTPLNITVRRRTRERDGRPPSHRKP